MGQEMKWGVGEYRWLYGKASCLLSRPIDFNTAILGNDLTVDRVFVSIKVLSLNNAASLDLRSNSLLLT